MYAYFAVSLGARRLCMRMDLLMLTISFVFASWTVF